VDSGAGNLNTVLGRDFTIKGLIFTGTGTTAGGQSVTIGGSNTLTIGADGITVQAGSAAHAISSNVALGTSQTWTNNSSNALTVSGRVSGSSGLATAGAGTLVLSGSNTYGGGTTVNSGTLQLGGDSALGTGGVTMNAGTLDLHGFSPAIGDLSGSSGAVITTTTGGLATLTAGGAANTSYAGILSDGAGQLAFVKNGAGMLTLSGSNTYSGGTTVNAGTLQLGDTFALGAPGGSLVMNGGMLDLNGFSPTIGALSGGGGAVITTSVSGRLATLTTNSGTNTIYAGTLTDGAGRLALVKTGTGVLMLTSSNSYSGGTTLIAGTLAAANSYAFGTGNVLVDPGVLEAAGALKPIKIGGDYVQLSEGGLLLRLGGAGAGQYDQLVVAGKASLAGALDLVSFNGFQPMPGDKFALIVAAGGVTGRFDSVEQPDFAVKLEVQYGPNGVTTGPGAATSGTTVVVVEAEQAAFAEFARTANQRAVARALDREVGDGQGGDFRKVLANLDLVTLDQLPGVFDQFSPAVFGAMTEISRSYADAQFSNVRDRIDGVHNGATGFNGGLSMTDSIGFMSGTNSSEGKSITEDTGKETNPMRNTADNRWGVFAAGSGVFTNIERTADEAAANFQTGGVTIGVDYRVMESLVFGLFGGYAGSHASIPNGDIDVNSGNIGLYAAYFQGGFYAHASASGGINGYDTKRDIRFANIQRVARGDTQGAEYDGMIGIGYDFARGRLKVGPTESLQYTGVKTDRFAESNAGALDLGVNSQKVDSLRNNLGARMSYAIPFANGKSLVPTVSAEWQHDFGAEEYAIGAVFRDDGGSRFSVSTPAIGRDSILIRAGVTANWSEFFSTSLNYQGDLGASHYRSHSVLGALNVAF